MYGKPIVGEAATEADIADFGNYSCRRLFVMKNINELPAPLLAEATVREADGAFGVLFDTMTEAETWTLADEFDGVLAVYRVLD